MIGESRPSGGQIPSLHTRGESKHNLDRPTPNAKMKASTTMDPTRVVTKLKAHEGTIHPCGLISEIEKFRAPQSRMSSYYLNLNSHQPTEIEAIRIEIKDAMDEQRQQFERLELDLCHPANPNVRVGIGL